MSAVQCRAVVEQTCLCRHCSFPCQNRDLSHFLCYFPFTVSVHFCTFHHHSSYLLRCLRKVCLCKTESDILKPIGQTKGSKMRGDEMMSFSDKGLFFFFTFLFKDIVFFELGTWIWCSSRMCSNLLLFSF